MQQSDGHIFIQKSSLYITEAFDNITVSVCFLCIIKKFKKHIVSNYNHFPEIIFLKSKACVVLVFKYANNY